MGQLLKETDLHQGARGIGKSGLTDDKATPFLSDLGITWRESSKAQVLAATNMRCGYLMLPHQSYQN